jgi:uncharacterized protein (DUF4415 family)
MTLSVPRNLTRSPEQLVAAVRCETKRILGEDIKSFKPATALPASLQQKLGVRGAQKAPEKERITIRLSREVVERFRATELENRHMKRLTQRWVVAACAFALVACTSFQPLPDRGQAEASRAHRQAQGVVVGDVLRIKPKQAPAFDLVVTAITADAIAGTEDGRHRQVQIAEVESLERKQFDGLRTALLVGGLALIALGQFAKGASKLANP